ncbi:MAG: S-methyl-5-thioribose-1-phosphate isomerase [Spirochaetota bacterium]
MARQSLQYLAFSLNEKGYVDIIDQTKLPFEKILITLKTSADAEYAIKSMQVRGAGVIGNIAALGVYLAAKEKPEDKHYIHESISRIGQTRPTAVNLHIALERMKEVLKTTNVRLETALLAEAVRFCEEDRIASEKIAGYGCTIIENIYKDKKDTVNVLTHCNAGRLAIIGKGTALAPIYAAFEKGLPVHVWVDETRPRNQGANLTSWELQEAGIPHTVIVDNAAGFLMKKSLVDMVVVGADRVTATGHVANKVGTYQKALAAKDNGIPFCVAYPKSTLDENITDEIFDIPIEERDSEEITRMRGLDKNGNIVEVDVYPPGRKVSNYSFDITPRELVSYYITENGNLTELKVS